MQERGLSLARNYDNKQAHVPNSKAIQDIFKFCSLSAQVAPEITAELMTYFLAGYEQALKDARSFDKPAVQEMYKEVKSAVDNFVDSVKNKQTSNYLWNGQELPSAFQELQQRLAAAAAKLINEKEISLDYAVNELAQFLRVYTENGKTIDAATIAAIDELFNAWLTKNGLISKGGVIYEADKDGNIKKDSSGNMVKTSAEKLVSLIENKQNGFSSFMQKSNNSVQISTNQCAYPEEKVAPAQKPTSGQQAEM